MAIKAGSLISIANTILVDRVQTAGPGQVSINRTKIYEMGNYLSVGSVTDLPDTTWSCESFDCSAEFEAMLTGQTFAGMADGTTMNPAAAYPIDVASEFKAGSNAASPFNVVGSVAIPYLNLESLSYKYGISNNASQSASLRGDLVFYNPGSTYIQEATGTNTANQAVILTNVAIPYTGDTVAGIRYTLSVCLESGKRLTFGTDFTEAATGASQAKNVTVTILAAVPTTDKIRIIYGSTVVAAYPQASSPVDSATRPAALRGRNIEVWVGGHVLATNRWTSVQSVQADWKVTLQRDEEFSNASIVNQDFDVPDVSGNIVIKPRDYAELYKKLRTIANVADGEAVGPLTTAPMTLDIVLKSPTDGSNLKTISIPDARFDLPGFSGQVQNKLDLTLNFTGDSGAMTITKGRPW